MNFQKPPSCVCTREGRKMDEGGIFIGDTASSAASHSKLGSSRAKLSSNKEFSSLKVVVSLSQRYRTLPFPVRSTLLKYKYVFKRRTVEMVGVRVET